MLKLKQFDYHLPEDRIAQEPVVPRHDSQLLVLSRKSGEISHQHFYDLADILKPGDVLVRNNTKVIPARLLGQKTSGGKLEILLNKKLKIVSGGEIWEAMTKPGLKPGHEVIFSSSLLKATCQAIHGYTREIRFNMTGEELFAELDKIGLTPLPPYIEADAEKSGNLADQYQTIFAKYQGSAAAPTAGLHFTDQVESELRKKNIDIVELTLHVGLGTFLPVKDENISSHTMHSEIFELSGETADTLNQAKQSGRRIISVGTTTTRVLESCSSDQGELTAKNSETDIFIYPGYKYKFVDGLITNFHLPKSTLLMLVSAFVSQPNTNQQFSDFESSIVGKAYAEAIEHEYRFYSFGDAMLII